MKVCHLNLKNTTQFFTSDCTKGSSLDSVVCKLPKGFLFDLSLSMESLIIKIISRHLRNMFYEAGKITQSAACPFLWGGGGGGGKETSMCIIYLMIAQCSAMWYSNSTYIIISSSDVPLCKY